MSDIKVVDDTPLGTTLPGIPTPRLIEVGRGEAYFVPNTNEADRVRMPGVWYLREGNYQSPDGKYVRVRIVVS